MKERFRDGRFVRPYQQDVGIDTHQLLTLLSEVEAADQEGNEVSESALRKQLTWPGFKRWVVESPDDSGVLVAEAWTFTQTTERAALHVAVHPAWRRRGLGTTLLAHLLDQMPNGTTEILASAGQSSHAAADFLCGHGFAPVGSSWLLHAPVDLAIQEPVWPEGYSVRSYDEVQHPATLVEALNRSFGDMWGHAENTEGAVDEAHVTEHLLKVVDPKFMLLMFAPDGGIAGFCKLLLSGTPGNQSGTDILDGPGIVPELRHRHLHRPLVLTAMQRRRHGHGVLRLEAFGDDEATIDIYRDIGFVLDRHDVTYLKTLD